VHAVLVTKEVGIKCNCVVIKAGRLTSFSALNLHIKPLKPLVY